MSLRIIVARAQNGVIGANGTIPWRLSADLQRFRKITWGKPIIMGRHTHESITRVLPGRENIVLTTTRTHIAGCTVYQRWEQIRERFLNTAEQGSIIGGRELYLLALPVAEYLHLTEVIAEVNGDVSLPALDLTPWQQIHCSEYAADENNEYPHRYSVWQRLTTEVV